MGISSLYLIVPHPLPPLLNGEKYRQFLEETFPSLLKKYAFTKTKYVPQMWPPRSPNLNLLDYFLWRYLKLLVHTTLVVYENGSESRARLSIGFNFFY